MKTKKIFFVSFAILLCLLSFYSCGSGGKQKSIVIDMTLKDTGFNKSAFYNAVKDELQPDNGTLYIFEKRNNFTLITDRNNNILRLEFEIYGIKDNKYINYRVFYNNFSNGDSQTVTLYEESNNKKAVTEYGPDMNIPLLDYLNCIDKLPFEHINNNISDTDSENLMYHYDDEYFILNSSSKLTLYLVDSSGNITETEQSEVQGKYPSFTVYTSPETLDEQIEMRYYFK